MELSGLGKYRDIYAPEYLEQLQQMLTFMQILRGQGVPENRYLGSIEEANRNDRPWRTNLDRTVDIRQIIPDDEFSYTMRNLHTEPLDSFGALEPLFPRR